MSGLWLGFVRQADLCRGRWRANDRFCRESRGFPGEQPLEIGASGPSGWNLRAGGYLRGESPDRAWGGKNMDVGVTGMCGHRLPRRRTAAAAMGEQSPPESARSHERRIARQANRILSTHSPEAGSRTPSWDRGFKGPGLAPGRSALVISRLLIPLTSGCLSSIAGAVGVFVTRADADPSGRVTEVRTLAGCTVHLKRGCDCSLRSSATG